MEKKIDLSHFLNEDSIDNILSVVDKLLDNDVKSRMIDYTFNVDLTSFELCIKYKEEYT